jgi:DNA-directed RNA polymerase specialized sigma24 family protein
MGGIEAIFKKHDDWVDIVQTFGCNKETAEDLVQEMYIKIQLKINNGLDISFGEGDINHIYVFKTLRTLFLDLKRKEKNIYFESDEVLNDVESDFSINNFDLVYDQVKKELNNMYWYDRKIFDLIDNGKSIAELSRDTNISYYSLYNTYRKVIEKLKEKLWD